MSRPDFPFTIHTKTGIPADAVKAARLQRFANWLYERDPEFRAAVDLAAEEDVRAIFVKAITGALDPERST